MTKNTDTLNRFVKRPIDGALRTFDTGNKQIYFYIDYSNPGGKNKFLQICDVLFPFVGFELPYHYHDIGAVTYIILKGQIELVLNGKRCICSEGDIINIPSHCPYGMKILNKETLIREVYTNLDALGTYIDMELLGAGEFYKACDSLYMEENFAEEHHYFALTKPIEVENVDKAMLAQITPRNESIYEYDGMTGIICSLKVGRWNLKRDREIWEYKIDVNYQMQYSNPGGNEHFYSVVSGDVMVETGGHTYTAAEKDIIHIPAYTPFSITALSDETVVYDLNVNTRLFRMLEMLELAQRDEPENVKKEEWIRNLLDLNDSELTGFVKTNLVNVNKV